jgi:ABC-2 type transport system permease protein
MKLSRIYIDFISSLKILFRGGSSFFWVLAFPIIVMLVLGSVYGQDVSYKLAIQDKDNSSTAAALVKAFNSTQNMTVNTIAANEDAEAYMRSSGIGAVLIIPVGFGKQVQQNVALSKASPTAGGQVNSSMLGQTNTSSLNVVNIGQAPLKSSNNTTAMPATLTLLVDQSQLVTPGTIGVVDSIAKGFVTQIAGSGQLANVTTQQILPSQFKNIDFFMPGIISLAVLTIGVLGTSTTNTEYRLKGILRKLSTTPLGKSDWLIAKMLYQFVVVLISTALIFVVAKLVYDVATVPDAATLLLLFVGTICFTGIGMIVARLVKSEEAASAASMAIIFPMLFLSGAFQPLQAMPDYVQTVANVLPLTFLTNGLRDAMILGDTASALYNMSVVLITGVVFCVIGALITDWRDR